jgi:ABC-type uncharacterized transport system substrate-binding protein
MDRRAFIGTVASALLAAPLAAGAPQAGKVWRIGFLRAGQPPESYLDGFQQGLRERGYVYGQNVVVEFRATDGSVDPLPRLTEELLRLKVDVFLASAAPAAVAVKRATTSVPIVFVGVVDPVALGLVPSLGRPGGSITGLAPPPLLISRASAWSCSGQSSPASGESPCSGIRPIRATRSNSKGRRPQHRH